MASQGEAERVDKVPLPLRARLFGLEKNATLKRTKVDFCESIRAKSYQLLEVNWCAAAEFFNDISLCRVVSTIVDAELVTDAIRHKAAHTSRIGAQAVL